jgi:thiol-disulfide isomerase/thioredoxin
MKTRLFIFFIILTQITFSQEKKNYSMKLDRVGSPELLRLVSASKGLVLYDLKSTYFADVNKKIKYPSKVDFAVTDTAYTEITAKTSNCESIQDDKHILVYNAKSSMPTLFLDNAGSYDFSQSKPIQLKDTYTLNFFGKKYSKISYTIRKQKEKEQIFPAFSFPMLETPPIDFKNWLIIQDSFIKAGDIKKENFSFSIALYDANSDGIYNEAGVDKVLIDSYKQDYFLIFNNDIVSTSKIQDVNTFESDGRYFEITKIEADGSGITFNEIKPLKEVTIKKSVSLPNVTYVTSNDENKNLTDNLQKGKYLFVEIWASYCPPCIKAIPVLNELNKNHSDKLSILGLYDTQNVQELKSKIEQYAIQYPQGLSNKAIDMNLLLNGYPHGVLFDESGKIVKYKISAEEVKQFIEALK